MNERFVESREAVIHAREALRRGNTTEARQWAERAAQLAPQSEDPWLVLAAVASPRESMDFIRKAIQVNPDSPRARKGMVWAMERLRESPEGKVDTEKEKQTNPVILFASMPKVQVNMSKDVAGNENEKKPGKRSPLFPILLVLMGCAVFGFAAWSAMTSPALASILSISSASNVQPTHGPSFAQAEIAKPTYTPVSGEISVLENVASTQSTLPTDLPTTAPADIPLSTATFASELTDPEPTFTPESTSTPGSIYAEIVPDTPTSEYIAPTAAPAVPNVPAPVMSNGGEHWIDVDLTQQRLYAYEGDTVVNSFLVSTGTWQTPTVTGKFKIWIKLLSTDMTGPGYYLPDVPYTMYFYKDYGLHGTYWHHNFGTPMSHGCVNLSIPDAEWLYNFSSVGTVVNVHY